MKETYKTWRFVRYFRDNYLRLCEWDLKSDRDFGDSPMGLSKEYLNKFFSTLMQEREPRVSRANLVLDYSRAISGNQFTLDKYKGTMDELASLAMSHAQDVQLRIQNAISGGYIGTDKDGIQTLYLTLEGHRFAEWYGLIKAWLVNDIGILGSVVIALIVGCGFGLGIVQLHEIISFISEI